MLVSFRVILFGMSLMGVACGRDSATAARSTAAHSIGRRISPLPTDTAWIRGGRKTDYILKYPEYLAHDAARVYVTDIALHQVLAFAQATGEQVWRTGETDAKLRSPSVIAGLPGGGVAVLDGPASLVLLDSSGRRRTELPLSEGEQARGICALSDTTFLVAFRRQRLPLVIVNAEGAVRKRIDLPWPATRGLSTIQTQLVMAGGSAGRCVIALIYGEGMAGIKGDTVEWTTPYVEHIPLPKLNTRVSQQSGVDTKRVAVRDLTVDDTVAAVIFEGDSAERGRFVDQYDARTGSYLRTSVAGRRVVGLQLHAERAFCLLGLQGYPALVALPIAQR
jgi:PQQ-like domain